MAQRVGYSGLQVALHWSIAALVVFQLVVNDAMPDAFHKRLDNELLNDHEGLFSTIHVTVGVTILILALARVAARLALGAPPVHRDKPIALVYLAYVTHFALYGFILLMPIAGAIAWLGKVEDVGHVHAFAGTILIPLIALHVAGALTEHFFFRNDTLKRMLVPNKRSGASAEPPQTRAASERQ